MPLAVSLTLQDVYTKLRALVIDVVPAGVACVQGLGNRIASPPPLPGYVVMTATGLKQLRTPVDRWDLVSLNPNAIAIEQGTQITIQLDCYGPVSGDWAVMLATVLRNGYSVPLLAPVAPLYADDPIQAALINSELQYEQRWIVGANLQYNPVVTVPMQFANQAQIDLINVDVEYPP